MRVNPGIYVCVSGVLCAVALPTYGDAHTHTHTYRWPMSLFVLASCLVTAVKTLTHYGAAAHMCSSGICGCSDALFLGKSE